ncbi:hypothetical protein AGMMS50268_41280 [Spirochaetia bacterium]|nr:hypothetical protein AGMMS50268_41280 [Spirochaetia bacterium]
MYLLQSGIEATANLDKMPVKNIITLGLIALIAIPLIAVCVVFIIKKLNIKKIGPVQMMEEQKKENDQHNKAISCLHYMDEEINEIDSDLRTECHQIVLEFTPHMNVVLRDITSDEVMRGNLVSNMKVILSGSVIRNHFTRELMPERYAKYRARIIGQIEDFYRNIFANIGPASMLPWEEVRGIFVAILDEWINRIKAAVSVACEEKVEVYERYKLRFKPDNPWFAVAEECRSRNSCYINILSA